jgi:chorismate mutase/prephenate dehydratase
MTQESELPPRPDLDSARETIDSLDRELLRLLARRMDAVREIADFKQRNPEAPLRDDGREREVFETWASRARAEGLSPYFAGRVLREVLNWSRRDQERFLSPGEPSDQSRTLRVGYQGVPGCYSDLAITKLFATRPERLARTGHANFASAFDALEAGELDYALLPIENTIVGSIHEVYDLLARRKVTIVGEEVWRVEHCLLALPGVRTEELRAIRSHPVALQQCQRFLRELSHCSSESFHDTAGAARSVAEEGRPEIGAVASEEAGEQYGLVVLARGIADQPHNLTRFVLLAREAEPVDLRRPAKTSLFFSLCHRRGALLECLRVLDAHGLNLTKIESRPEPGVPWEYLFTLDFEGNIADPNVKGAVEELGHHTNSLKLLGSYPRRVDQAGELEARDVEALRPEAPSPSGANGTHGSLAAANACPTVPATAKNDALRLVRRRDGQQAKPVRVGGVEFGGERFVLIAGPCAVESRVQIHESAKLAREHGARVLRGGAFKPRSSPYDFQGLGFEGLELLAEAGRAFEMPIVTEVLRPEDVGAIAERADMLQVGARNMQNFALLREVGRTSRPVLLKRGMSATIQELLLAAEYVMAEGNQRVILCERGIRTFETATRNTLDVSAVPVLKERTHLPVIVDPSHAAGIRRLVVPLALAAAAAGADGLIVEAHYKPEEALCDKDQALTATELTVLHTSLEPIVALWGKRL